MRTSRRCALEREPPPHATRNLGQTVSSAARRNGRNNGRSQRASSTWARAAASGAGCDEFNTHSALTPARRFSPTRSFTHRTRGGIAALATSNSPRPPGKRLSAFWRAIHNGRKRESSPSHLNPRKCRKTATPLAPADLQTCARCRPGQRTNSRHAPWPCFSNAITSRIASSPLQRGQLRTGT